MIQLKTGLVVTAAVAGAMALSACATKEYVNTTVSESVAAGVGPVDAAVRATQTDLAATRADLTAAQGALQGQGAQVSRIDGQLTQVSATARQALERADAAGKLAEGKFMYSVVLSDDGVRFPASSAQLSDEARTRLTELANRLKGENKNVFLEIQGYTDATGSPAGNNRIGQERAETVRRFLSTQGVPLNRMSTISYGEDNPVAPNTTRDGRAQNRRVVVVVLS